MRTLKNDKSEERNPEERNAYNQDTVSVNPHHRDVQ